MNNTQSSTESSSQSTNLMANTMIVFDYDDSLFPTTKWREIMLRPTKDFAVYENKCQELKSKMTEQEMIEFINLSSVTFKLLTSYIKQYSLENICIVTASRNGWINKSLQSVYSIGHFKQIYELLFNENTNDDKEKILICHPSNDIFKCFQAKGIHYSDISQHPCFIWKYNIFQQIFLNKYIPSDQIINTFIFIGDSEWEYQAAKQLKDTLEMINIYMNNDNLCIDRIKLMNKPSLNSLKEEQTLLHSSCGDYEKHSYLNKTGFDIDYLSAKKKFKTTLIAVVDIKLNHIFINNFVNMFGFYIFEF